MPCHEIRLHILEGRNKDIHSAKQMKSKIADSIVHFGRHAQDSDGRNSQNSHISDTVHDSSDLNIDNVGAAG